eukprot:CAMPEP_0179212060 /NCGR_PEP_ID=MMETSP0797-20121207/871_1 /TAXON_ID=47934 /ORGANISM="Dinophysis acuminata, Strain DAEP01" /LENGTH=115 /DNA_ID=CAMNT_0020917581 /DNA_START=138 /DNA_END=485 /DNA_ORIENTATION=-
MSGGLLSAIMQNHCLPTGSLLDVNTSIFLSELGSNIFGRCGGAPIARLVLQKGGQHQFFLQQTTTCAFAALLSEMVLLLKQKTAMGAVCMQGETTNTKESQTRAPNSYGAQPGGG